MWTSWWCSFRSCFSFVQSSEHTSSVAQSKADFHAHTRRSQKHKSVDTTHVCLSVHLALPTTLLSIFLSKQNNLQSLSKIPVWTEENKNSSTSKSVPCIVVVNAHCSGPQKENQHLHSLCLFFLAICAFFTLPSELKTPLPGTYQKTLTLTTERVSRSYLLFTTPYHHRRRRSKK